MLGGLKKPRKGSKTKQIGENSCLLGKSIRPESGQQQETPQQGMVSNDKKVGKKQLHLRITKDCEVYVCAPVSTMPRNSASSEAHTQTCKQS